MDQVGEERDAASRDVDRGLDDRRDGEDAERDSDRPEPGLRSDDRCELLCLDLDLAEAVRATLPATAEVANAAAKARALADPTRLSVANALAHGGELCGCDLAWMLGRAQNLVSHHLKSLRDVGMVDARREGKTVFFRLTDDGLDLLGHLMGDEVPA